MVLKRKGRAVSVGSSSVVGITISSKRGGEPRARAVPRGQGAQAPGRKRGKALCGAQRQVAPPLPSPELCTLGQ